MTTLSELFRQISPSVHAELAMVAVVTRRTAQTLDRVIFGGRARYTIRAGARQAQFVVHVVADGADLAMSAGKIVRALANS